MIISADESMPTQEVKLLQFGPEEIFKCLYLIVKKMGGVVGVQREKVEKLSNERKLHIFYDRNMDCFRFVADVEPQDGNHLILPNMKIMGP